jgi:hypothetical protein
MIERGGILWTYMGPPELQPPVPEFEFAMLPPERRQVTKRLQESNYLQAMEGGIDSSHIAFLHSGAFKKDSLLTGAAGNQYLNDFQVKFEVVESEGGLLIGARRNAADGNFYWRITQWIMPYFTAIPPRADHVNHGHFWVPIDDENCWAWSYAFHPTRDLSAAELDHIHNGNGIHAKLIPGTFIPEQNKSNDYMMNRAAQKEGTAYSGIEGVAVQDSSLQESMGPIIDRTRENLVSTDNGIIMARHRLLKAVRAMQEGLPPPALDPGAQRVRAASVILPPGAPFKEAAKEALIARPGVPMTSV